MIFALVLLVAAGWKFNAGSNEVHADNLRKITYPVDSEGVTCGLEAGAHPYLYFTSLEDPVRYRCDSDKTSLREPMSTSLRHAPQLSTDSHA